MVRVTKDDLCYFAFDEYRKKVITKAVCMDIDFTVITVHGNTAGKAGDYLCVDDKGFPYHMDKGIFETTYEKVR